MVQTDPPSLPLYSIDSHQWACLSEMQRILNFFISVPRWPVSCLTLAIDDFLDYIFNCPKNEGTYSALETVACLMK